jgi:hypothetical protein
MLKRNANRSALNGIKPFLIFGAALAFAVFCCGCGKSMRYDLPSGKTLVYGMNSISGAEENGQEVASKATKKQIYINVNVLDHVGGYYGIQMTAQPRGVRQNPVFGNSFGSLSMRMDDKGTMSNITGMGIPVELRLIMPILPENRLRNKQKWKEAFKRKILNEKSPLKIERQFMGKALIAGRQCYHIRGTLDYKFKDTLRGANLSADATLGYHYVEDFYLSLEGYPLKMTTKEQRRRTFVNSYNKEVLFDNKDFLNIDVIFLRLE